MLSSSITATSSEGTLGWPTPTAAATIATISTKSRAEKDRQIALREETALHRGGSITVIT